MICSYHMDSRKVSKIFSKEDFFFYRLVLIEYMKLFVGKDADSKTRRSCILTDSVKSDDDCPILVQKLGLGHILVRIRPTCHTWLVKVM